MSEDLYSPPTMPLYWDRLIADTTDLTAEEFGAYMLLLNRQWTKGGIPADNSAMARIARVKPARMKAIRTVLGERLQPHPAIEDSVYSPFMERVREEMQSRNRARTAAGSQGGRSKWGTEQANKNKRAERLRAARERGTHTDDEWRRLLDLCGHRCVRCGTQEAEIVKDHVVLLARDGSDAISNLQPLCRRCNSAKGPDCTDYVSPGIREAFTKQTPSNATDYSLSNAEQTPEFQSPRSIKSPNGDGDGPPKQPALGVKEPSDLGAWQILDAAWPVVSTHHDLAIGRTDWRSHNKRAAKSLANSGKTPEQVVKMLTLAYTHPEGRRWYGGITTLAKLIEHWPKIAALEIEQEPDEQERRKSIMRGDFMEIC